jgi:hypothetical protein
MNERNESLWQRAWEAAVAEATHESEIEARAMVYYRELLKRQLPQREQT